VFTVVGTQKMGHLIRAAPVCCIQQRASVGEAKWKWGLKMYLWHTFFKREAIRSVREDLFQRQKSESFTPCVELDVEDRQ
jgi:hypothetical protein